MFINLLVTIPTILIGKNVIRSNFKIIFKKIIKMFSHRFFKSVYSRILPEKIEIRKTENNLVGK